MGMDLFRQQEVEGCDCSGRGGRWCSFLHISDIAKNPTRMGNRGNAKPDIRIRVVNVKHVSSWPCTVQPKSIGYQ